MSDNPGADFTRQIFDQSLHAPIVPSGPHPVEDEYLMMRWSDDRLNELEEADLKNHLRICPQCKDHLTTLVNCKILDIPVDLETLFTPQCFPQDPPQSAQPISVSRRELPVWLRPLIAIAAMVAIAVFIIPGDSNNPDRISRLKERVPSEPAAVLNDAEVLLPSLSDDGEIAALHEVISSAAMRLTIEATTRRDSSEVSTIAERLESLGVNSTPLWEHVAAAETRHRFPDGLAMLDQLHQTHTLTGTASNRTLPIKSMTPDEKLKLDRQRFNQLLQSIKSVAARHPDNPGLQIELARLMIAGNQFEDAAELLHSLTLSQPDHVEALRLYGVVLFRLARFIEAADMFGIAASLAPPGHNERINQAISLEASGQVNLHQKAQSIWKRLYEEIDDADLKRRIADEVLE